jgi:hypothetical protein
LEKPDFQHLRDRLPVTMSRPEVPKLLGGIVSSKTLANADSRGIGPEGRFRVGSKVCYQTDKLLAWLEKRIK